MSVRSHRAGFLLAVVLLSPHAAANEGDGSVIRILPRGSEAPRVPDEDPRPAPGAEAPTAPPETAPKDPDKPSSPDRAERAPEPIPPPGDPALPPELLPSVPPPRPRPAAPSAAPPPPGPTWVPWVGVGAGVILGGLGAFFATEASRALDEQDLSLEVEGDRAELTDAFRETQGRVVGNTIAATALLSTAGASLVIGLLSLLED